ncbi:MAG: hypothetical protein CL537_06155 [Alcanivoracaceae bacterium]|nr:hypothetical protein [Alcanivoracaceae bacterium]|tara:strand:+ start:1856 stop:2554 length:699 start_codon:yes stop_codon:yes gene_type:complete
MTQRQGLVLMSCLISLSSTLFAGQLTVAPLTMSMTPTQANATYKLTNGSSEEGFYQLQLFAWEQVDGETQLLKQDDLIVTPPVTLIPGNGEQTVRVIRRRPTPSETEKSYRLIISEVPDTESRQGANLKVLLRMSLPVFVGGNEKAFSLSVSQQGNALHIHNTGNAHARIADVYWLDHDSNTHLVKQGLVGYALPNSELRIPLQTPSSLNASYLSASINGKPATYKVEGAPK